MNVSVSVGGVATVLPGVEPRVQSHYFLNQTCNFVIPLYSTTFDLMMALLE